MFGKIVYANNQKVVVELDSQRDQEKLLKWTNHKITPMELFIADGRRITPEQRKKTFGMFHDISDYTGYSMVETEELMKYRYLAICDYPKYFSLSDCSVTRAKDFLQFIIDFCIKENIPFKTKVEDEIADSYALIRSCCLTRTCCICGKYADIHHVDTIGMGNNRQKVNHLGRRILPLCRKHHTMIETIGYTAFCQKFQIKPIKVDTKLVKKLGLESQKQIENVKGNFKEMPLTY